MMGFMQIGLVLDSCDPDALAPFWAGALEYVVAGSVGNYVMLVPDGREGPKLLIQRVAEHKAAKNRMHLDIEVGDVDGLVEKLESLGATRLGTEAHAEHGMRWIVMADPEGNEFCVCDAESC